MKKPNGWRLKGWFNRIGFWPMPKAPVAGVAGGLAVAEGKSDDHRLSAWAH